VNIDLYIRIEKSHARTNGIGAAAKGIKQWQ